MKNFVQPGNVIEVPAAAAAVIPGQVVVVGALLAVANGAAEAGQPFNASLSGVYDVPKAAGTAFALGQPLMWDASAGAFTAVGTAAAGDVAGAGVTAHAPAVAGATVAAVRFAGIPGTVAA